MQQPEPLSAVDNAWLRMDRPTNLMMICGVMMAAERFDLNQVKAVIDTRLLCFHRFRQRIVRRGGAALWETDPDFDLDWHVRRVALPGAGGPAELEQLVSDLISTALDAGKPMWQFHVIDGAPGSSALALRIHHCYGDGFALTHVVGGLTDADPAHPSLPGPDLVAPGPRRSAWERLLGPLTEALGDSARLAQALLAGAADWLSHPSHAAASAAAGLALAGELAAIAGMGPDAPTRFKGKLGVMKRVAWAPPLSLFEVKALAEALACSVNDVLLACVTGALRSYLLAQGDLAPQDDLSPQLEIRALVPVNLRPPGAVTELGNQFGLVFLSLPIGEPDPVRRLLAVQARMRQLRRSRQATVALAILAAMGSVPDAIKEKLLDTLAANASAVVTNVRGPSEPRYLAGRRITRQIFWVPQSGGIGIGVSLLSYAGQVDLGVVTDTRRVPDPADLVQRFVREFETLMLTALLMPWPEPSGKGRPPPR
jgi:diacylglycerol O-acyltransferase